jgi:hypothetical protein
VNIYALPPISRRRFLSTAAGLAALSVSGATAAHAARRNEPLLAGASKGRMTPPLSVPYLTSSANGTSAPFQGVHDDLFARALVLDDGRRKLALLSVDSIGYDNGYLGYFPTRTAYAEGGYEVTLGAWSRVAPGSAERLWPNWASGCCDVWGDPLAEVR